MSNWIKFDAEKPETWVRNTDMLVRLSVNAKCIYGHFDDGDTDLFRMQADGRRVIMAEDITHYMIPTETKPSDHVSVPRELSEEDSVALNWPFTQAIQDNWSVDDLWCAFLNHFQDQSPETKEQE